MMSSVGNEADDLAFGGEIPVESQVRTLFQGVESGHRVACVC